MVVGSRKDSSFATKFRAAGWGDSPRTRASKKGTPLKSRYFTAIVSSSLTNLAHSYPFLRNVVYLSNLSPRALCLNTSTDLYSIWRVHLRGLMVQWRKASLGVDCWTSAKNCTWLFMIYHKAAPISDFVSCEITFDFLVWVSDLIAYIVLKWRCFLSVFSVLPAQFCI